MIMALIFSIAAGIMFEWYFFGIAYDARVGDGAMIIIHNRSVRRVYYAAWRHMG